MSLSLPAIRWGSSLSLLLAGLLVFILSLHLAHSQQTRAASFDPKPSSAPLPRWWDPSMPGAPGYLAQRLQDRLEFRQAEESERPLLALKFAHERSGAAQYALEHQDPDMALTTLSKSFGYLHMAAHACGAPIRDNPECAMLSTRFAEVAQQLEASCELLRQQTASDDLHAHVSRLQSDLEFLQSQFGF